MPLYLRYRLPRQIDKKLNYLQPKWGGSSGRGTLRVHPPIPRHPRL